MEFLKEILGEELFNQVAEKINAHNGNEANKEKQVKLANLGGGEYVGKGKYDALNELLTGKQSELDAANGLISELQKGTKGNKELQDKINVYETQTIPDMQKQMQETREKAAVKFMLLEEKALPESINYLTFMLYETLKEQGKSLELEENDTIKNHGELRDSLKTRFPKHFESAKGNGGGVEPFELPYGDNGRSAEPKTLADALRMKFEDNK